jgi:hypothetical protein
MLSNSKNCQPNSLCFRSAGSHPVVPVSNYFHPSSD